MRIYRPRLGAEAVQAGSGPSAGGDRTDEATDRRVGPRERVGHDVTWRRGAL